MKYINFIKAISKVTSLVTSAHPASGVKCLSHDEARYRYSDLEMGKVRNSRK